MCFVGFTIGYFIDLLLKCYFHIDKAVGTVVGTTIDDKTHV